MMWLLFSLSVGIIGGSEALIHKFLLRDCEHTPYAAFFNLIGGILYLPIFIIFFQAPDSYIGWLYILFGSLVWTFGTWISFKARKLTEVSILGPLGHTRIIFTLLISYALLAEPITSSKILGISLIFLGTTILTMKDGKLFSRLKEVAIQVTLFSAFVAAIANITDKVVIGFSSPATYGLFAYLIPGLIIGYSSKKMKLFPKIFKSKLKLILLVAAMDVVAYFLSLNAYQLTDVSNAVPVFQISTLISVLGGIIILKERSGILQKIVGALLTISGIIIISGFAI